MRLFRVSLVSQKTAIFFWTILAGVLIFLGAQYVRKNYILISRAPLTLDDLPAEAVFLPHPEDDAEAKRLGKISMAHYATPEAAQAGGPVYGTFGYGIAAVEYEIPLDSLAIRTVGDTSPGQLLDIPEIRTAAKTIPYDHFHVGISQHRHAEEETENSDDHQILIIHFMLIPHEVEEEHGLYCG